MEPQKVFNLLSKASDSRFMTRNGILPMINHMQIML